MYGFPTQTILETIDSLEMVRQLFETGVLQSGFWHQFAMTAHSPVGLNPERFHVIRETGTGTFANNDLIHSDQTGIDHEQFSFGLKKSLYNFMHGIGFDLPLQSWFDFKVPRTSIKPDFIEQAILESESGFVKPSSRIVWLGTQPSIRFYTKAKKGNQWEMAELTFHTRKDLFSIQVSKSQGIWLDKLLKEISVSENKKSLFHEIKSDYEQHNSGGDFEPFWYGKQLAQLKDAGLLTL
jgi:hypothetical protein